MQIQLVSVWAKVRYGKKGERVVKDTRGQKIFAIFNYLIITALVIITLYPFWHIVMASLSNPSQLMAHNGLVLKPLGFSTAAYQQVLNDSTIIRSFLNTLFIIVTKNTLSILLTLFGAYFLSRKDIMAAPAVSFLIVVTMFFSGGLVPTYLNVRDLHLDNRFGALIFPTVLNTFNLIILRTGFWGVPDSLEESARLDGAGDMRILFNILVPLILPSIMVVALYYIVATWNSWFDAMIYLRKRELFPLQLILREILVESQAKADSGDMETTTETIQYAVMTVSTVPILLVYPFMQKYFVKGATVGAVKG